LGIIIAKVIIAHLKLLTKDKAQINSTLSMLSKGKSAITSCAAIALQIRQDSSRRLGQVNYRQKGSRKGE
jgi:hypothetical protein